MINDGWYGDPPVEFDASEICPACPKSLGEINEDLVLTLPDNSDVEFCSKRCMASQTEKGWISKLADLAILMTIQDDPVYFESSISKAIFKSTNCGCCFSAEESGVTVSGYAEGSNAECPHHFLAYPFTKEEFWVELEIADQEGCGEWDLANSDWLDGARSKGADNG